MGGGVHDSGGWRWGLYMIAVGGGGGGVHDSGGWRWGL